MTSNDVKYAYGILNKYMADNIIVDVQLCRILGTVEEVLKNLVEQSESVSNNDDRFI